MRGEFLVFFLVCAFCVDIVVDGVFGFRSSFRCFIFIFVVVCFFFVVWVFW